MRWAGAVVVLMFLCVGLRADEERYYLPLFDSFGIIKDDPNFVSEQEGRYRLVEVTPITGAGFSSSNLATKLKQYAIHGKVIVGTTEDGYFIMDLSQPEYAQPQAFKTIEGWQLALKQAGIPLDVSLLDPDSAATKLPDITLRPWKYRVMRGALGLTDDIWSFVVQIAGMVLCLLIGLLGPIELRLLSVAILIGLIINIVGQIVIAGGGPGAFVGFFALPLWCWLAAGIGRGIRLALRGGLGAIRV